MTSPAVLRELADRVERVSPNDPAYELRAAIRSAVDPRSLPPMPRYHLALDAARSISTWIIVHASEIAADGRALVELSDTGGPCRPVNIARGVGSTLPAALCAASLRARAMEMEETQ